MSHSLPSFHIDVTEDPSSDESDIIYHISINTRRICNDVNDEQVLDCYRLNKALKINADENPGSFFTDVASRISSLSRQQLLDNFIDIRVFYKMRRLQKNYAFNFKNDFI